MQRTEHPQSPPLSSLTLPPFSLKDKKATLGSILVLELPPRGKGTYAILQGVDDVADNGENDEEDDDNDGYYDVSFHHILFFWSSEGPRLPYEIIRLR